MKTKLFRILEKLRKDRVIKNYSVHFGENKLNNTRSEVTLTISLNGTTIVDKSLNYNPEIQKASKVQDILVEDFEAQLLSTGLLSLYANKAEVNAY